MPGQASSSERPKKRSRVSRACDQCRTAREKCDGTQPTCLTCTASSRPCTYTSAPKKRGIQPGYIRTLELALTWLFQNTDSEVVLNKEIAQEGITSVLFGRETKESNRLHKNWRRSKFCKDVDRLLSGEQVGGTDDQTPKSDDDESDAEADVVVAQTQPSIPPAEELFSPTFTSPAMSRQTLRPLNSLEAARLPPDSQPPSLTALPPSSWRLIDIYFAYTQSWLPICEKHDVLRISYSYPEHGVILSAAEASESGDHAELWSILAVATHQAKLDPHEAEELPDAEQLYGIARNLIPTELASFTAGHVKALLNLAVINMGRNKVEASWLLVGLASRILKIIERLPAARTSRLKHIRASCFLLDGFLSAQLGPAYLQRSDVENVEEDGLEEWQPWLNPIHSTSVLSRTPILGLSSFNKLLDLTDVLISVGTASDATPQQSLRLDEWKASLPGKFGHLMDDRRQTPPNPPALLLHATYLLILFVLHSSTTPISQALDLIERHHQQLGVSALPPPINCLLNHIQNHNTYNAMDQGLQLRMLQISETITRAWSATYDACPVSQPPAPAQQGRLSFGPYQVPTPESMQIPLNPPLTPVANRPGSGRKRPSTTFIDDLLPDINSTTKNRASMARGANVTNFNVLPIEDEFRRQTLQPHHSLSQAMMLPDPENFFDDLASLDGVEKLDNQPQFMENLGFAPDANMADFLAAEFGQFIPNSSNFLPQNQDDPTHLDPAFFGAT
ncbi:hypothetical protein CC80DRAFT_306734 [Byssothecium circinans]|uniref:Zn(2)-C6 fungal-type domain-containing protein n=1 Tax=Byssothecium circinans TaxID=147558 RepID=A0A6A5U433_9PLEO|nr:hypothetical protein CC80DRAFT_306734 [Byssothecium circinans]